MEKIKAFFYIFSKSLTSPQYYKDVIGSGKGLSFKYFFTLALFASLITSVYVLVPMLPEVKATLNGVIEKTVSIYEDDLIITLKDGQVSINKPEPYIVPIPWEDAAEMPKNLIVFDSNGTVDDFQNKYDSFSMVNSSNIILRDQSGFRVEALKQIPDGVITKADVLNLAVKAEKMVVYVPYLLSAILFMGVFVYYAVLRFINLFVVASVLFVFGKIKNLSYKYMDFLKIAIHTFTLPLVIELVFKFVNYPLLAKLPMWFFLTNVAFGVFVLFSLSKNTQEPVKENIPD